MARLHRRIDRLNKLNFVSLHYQNALGTDLTVRLPEGHIWEGGDDRLPSGVPFIANMPTEEIFTSPLRDGVDGVVYASMPVSYTHLDVYKRQALHRLVKKLGAELRSR